MSVRLRIIEEQVEHYSDTSGDQKDIAFLKLACSLLQGSGYDDLEPEDIVDGIDEKQIDVVSVEEDAAAAAIDVLIVQAKNQDSFPTNYLTLMGNGLSWVFEKPKDEYTKLRNARLVKKINELRDARKRLGPSNMRVRVRFVTKGDTAKLSVDFRHELDEIRAKYSAAGFGEFSIEPLGATELVDLMAEAERSKKLIDDDLVIRYDRHVPSFIKYTSAGMTGYICTVPAKEIARLVTGAREASIFDLNLRRFYGIEKGRVNPDIASTCSNSRESSLFWFFNNGITVICNSADVVADKDNPHLKLKNVQIVNGCQTSMTLQNMFAQGKLRDDVEVLVKAFVTQDAKFISRVVLTTNNQNAISQRDLRANDDVQADYQRAFKNVYGFYYERKPGEFRSLKKEEFKKTISNEKVGQAYLAIVKKRPTTARAQKYRIWHPELYSTVFPDTDVGKHLLAYLIYSYCRTQKRAALQKWSNDEIRYSIVTYGVFHLARVVARRFTTMETWSRTDQVDAWIRQVLENPDVLKKHYGPSVTLIRKLISKRRDWAENIDNVFKATDIECALNKALNP
ncbi:MAG: AIPR family protein [Verrucomicrobia bacterium]|nr:AIPR family protein [Verrucomicrobiota bacterium]